MSRTANTMYSTIHSVNTARTTISTNNHIGRLSFMLFFCSENNFLNTSHNKKYDATTTVTPAMKNSIEASVIFNESIEVIDINIDPLFRPMMNTTKVLTIANTFKNSFIILIL